MKAFPLPCQLQSDHLWAKQCLSACCARAAYCAAVYLLTVKDALSTLWLVLGLWCVAFGDSASFKECAVLFCCCCCSLFPLRRVVWGAFCRLLEQRVFPCGDERNAAPSPKRTAPWGWGCSGWWRQIRCWGQVGGVAEISAAGNMRFEPNAIVKCKALLY